MRSMIGELTDTSGDLMRRRIAAVRVVSGWWGVDVSTGREALRTGLAFCRTGVVLLWVGVLGLRTGVVLLWMGVLALRTGVVFLRVVLGLRTGVVLLWVGVLALGTGVVLLLMGVLALCTGVGVLAAGGGSGSTYNTEKIRIYLIYTWPGKFAPKKGL